MGEQGPDPDAIRDEADAINAIGQDQARMHNRLPTEEDFRQASEMLDALRTTSPQLANEAIAIRAEHERAKPMIGPENMRLLGDLQERLEAALNDHLTDFRRHRVRYSQMRRQDYVELAQSEIESALKQVVDTAMEDPASVALFAGQDDYRRDWWWRLRSRLQRSAEREMLGL